MKPAKYAARFWGRVDRTDLFGCWSWQGPRRPDGYGIASLGGQTTPAHRVAWILANGSIPAGRVLRHDCDNRACCNPAHLQLGTHAENIADKVSRGRQAKGEGNGRAVLTVADVRAIRAAHASGLGPAAIAAAYPVSKRAVVKIVDRETWRHVA